MTEEIVKILVSRYEIALKVAEIGKQIAQDYQGIEKLNVICILKGASIFFADLVREIDLPHVNFDFMAVTSYGSSTKTTGNVQIIKDLDRDINGQHVLIVEDILDTGLTLHYLKRILSEREPASVKICTLFDKPSRRKTEVKADYVGFTIPDEFVVGYGLDYAEKYRNLKDACILKLIED